MTVKKIADTRLFNDTHRENYRNKRVCENSILAASDFVYTTNESSIVPLS